MKILVIAVAVFAAFLQADARSIVTNQEHPKFIKDSLDQAFSCLMEMGPKINNMPDLVTDGLVQLPEDDEALNQFWGCMFVKKGIINHNNDVDAKNLHDYVTDLFAQAEPNDRLRAAINDIAETCKDEEADEYQLKTIKIINCVTRLINERTVKD